jgi:signal transduction histidine kinase
VFLDGFHTFPIESLNGRGMTAFWQRHLELDQISMPADDGPGDPKQDRAIEESRALTEQCLNDTRTISHLLHPPFLDRVGLTSALRWYIAGFTVRSGIEARLNLAPDFPRLTVDAETTLFRIVQEGLTNVHRHSGSATADVRLCTDATSAILQIADQGKGFPETGAHGSDTHAVSFGVGIAGMRERVRQFKGHLQLSSQATGTTITATLPLSEVVREDDAYSHRG